MERECTTSAPTVEEAVDLALEQLGVQQDAVEYEVLEEPGRKMFGMGASREAKVRVWVKQGYLDEAVDEEHDEEPLEESDDVNIVKVPERREEVEELSDEQLDQVADTAAAALKQTLALFGIDEPKVEEYEGDEGEIILDVIGGDLGLLIGRHGKTLDALQTVVGAITTRELGFRYPVVVDVEGYRHRRRQKIEDMAHRAAERAVRQNSPVSMRPMTAYERRVVHVALRSDTRVSTGSEGAEPYRQVVISPN